MKHSQCCMKQNLNVDVVMCLRVTEAEELSRLIEGARYQLKLLPNKSLTLWLLFTARREATYNFELPISLLGYGFSVAGMPCPTHMLADSPTVASIVSRAEQVLMHVSSLINPPCAISCVWHVTLFVYNDV